MVRGALTLAEIAELPSITDLVTAGRALGLGCTRAYELARAGQFPCPVIRAGRAWLVPVAGLPTVPGLPAPGVHSTAPRATLRDPRSLARTARDSRAATACPRRGPAGWRLR